MIYIKGVDLHKGSIKGFEVMQYCLSTLLDGQARLGGRIVMLECKNVPYLIEFYGKFGFSKIEKDCEEGELLQMVKILSEDEIIEKKLPSLYRWQFLCILSLLSLTKAH